MLPILAHAFRMRKRVVGTRWRYHNNIVEQDHRTVKRVTDKMLEFTSFWSAKKRIAGLGAMHMIKNGQLHCPNGQTMSAAD
jgi:putative transposase